uniref:cellulose binding domain-containing protein n=1 Tax=Streptomyces sp. WELS2 TaxID=2749435 RepID=UPI0028680CFC
MLAAPPASPERTQAEVTVENTGSGALTGWSAGRDPAGATVTSLWNGTPTTAQGRATVRDAAFDGALSPGAEATSGFTATGAPGTPSPHCAGTWPPVTRPLAPVRQPRPEPAASVSPAR